MSYEPRGKVKILIDAMRAEPQRVWMSPVVAEVMEVQQGALTAHLDSAIRRGVLYRRLVDGRCEYALQPFEAAQELRVPKVGEAWTPRTMAAPRPGSDVRHVNPPPAAPSPAPRWPGVCDDCRRPECWDRGCQLAGAAIAAATPRPTPVIEARFPAVLLGSGLIPVAEPPALDVEVPKAKEDAEDDGEAVEFDAWQSLRTGEMILVGVAVDEDGRVTLTPENVALLRERMAWMRPTAAAEVRS